MENVKTKTEIRKEIKSKLKENLTLNKDYRAEHSSRICDNVLQTKDYDEADIILGYMPMDSEVNIVPLLKKAFQDDKKIALPRIVPDTSIMNFFFVTQQQFENQMQAGSYGIFEPDCNLPQFSISDVAGLKVLILVPGLAFTKKGARLGRGKGFYDIFMSHCENNNENFTEDKKFFSKKIGICFPCQILEHIPVAENDIDVDCVIF